MENILNRKVPCPYDSGHMIEPHRLAFHIARCKKNVEKLGGGSELRTCPFNNVHLLQPDEFKDHLRTCADRINHDPLVYASKSTGYRAGPNESAVPPVPPPQAVDDDEEDWGASSHPTYDPQKYLAENRNIITILKAEPPSVRRAHRMEQRRNFDIKKN